MLLCQSTVLQRRCLAQSLGGPRHAMFVWSASNLKQARACAPDYAHHEQIVSNVWWPMVMSIIGLEWLPATWHGMLLKLLQTQRQRLGVAQIQPWMLQAASVANCCVRMEHVPSQFGVWQRSHPELHIIRKASNCREQLVKWPCFAIQCHPASTPRHCPLPQIPASGIELAQQDASTFGRVPYTESGYAARKQS